jgi:hypothetical protein
MFFIHLSGEHTSRVEIKRQEHRLCRQRYDDGLDNEFSTNLPPPFLGLLGMRMT